MQWMEHYEAELHQETQERFGLSDGVSDEERSNDAPWEGEGKKMTTQSLAVDFFPVLVERPQTLPHVANVRSVDLEQLYEEDKLGCARGVLWALVFEIALIIVIAICWKLRVVLR